jgi:hypothetical protein
VGARAFPCTIFIHPLALGAMVNALAVRKDQPDSHVGKAGFEPTTCTVRRCKEEDRMNKGRNDCNLDTRIVVFVDGVDP